MATTTTPQRSKPDRRAAAKLAGDAIPRRILGRALQQLITRLELSRAETAGIVDDAASQISRLMTNHFEEFSADRLAGFFVALGADINLELVLPAKRSRRRGRVRITALGGRPARRRPAASPKGAPIATRTDSEPPRRSMSGDEMWRDNNA